MEPTPEVLEAWRGAQVCGAAAAAAACVWAVVDGAVANTPSPAAKLKSATRCAPSTHNTTTNAQAVCFDVDSTL
jgi:hypothetical protein